MVDWAKGYSACYYAEQVDPSTWRDVGVIEITEGTIKREATGKRQSADITCINYRIPVEQWMRVYLDVQQGGTAEHVALFTGLATSPSDEINGTLITNTLTCYSVLKPADDVIMPRGWYASAGANGGDLVKRLLSVSPAPCIVADAPPTLSESIVAENKETNLSMVDKILNAINWTLRIDGDGTIYVIPKQTEAAATFDPLNNDVLETSVKIKQDWYACPNVYMAVAGDVTGTARDDDPDSLFSTVNRGREMWKYESGVSLADNETIAEYAMRKLKEAQSAEQSASYTRRYVPSVMTGDVIMMHYPEQGLDGLYRVSSQSIKLGGCAATSEEVYKE